MAMEERRITHITYQSLQATEPITYDVYPLGMVSHGQSLYLVGWAPRRERLQHWKIDRIEDVEVTPLQFQQPEGFDLRQHLAKSFGIFHGEGDVHVKVRFSPTVARYVQEGRWHETQTPDPPTRRLPPGRVRPLRHRGNQAAGFSASANTWR